MGAILTIDIGNSRTKISVFSRSGQVIAECTEQALRAEAFSRLIEQYQIDCGAVCSVGHSDARMLETLRMMLGGSLLVVTADTPVPIKVQYATPHTLGADRVVAACGAVSLFPNTPLVIADAGTALTIDYVDASATFLGGNISAGVKMRLDALHRYTNALPAVSPQGDVPLWGTDTQTALRCGAVRGAAAEIMAACNIQDFAPQSDLRLLLTGGDANFLKPYLPQQAIVRQDIISQGLISLLKYNEYI